MGGFSDSGRYPNGSVCVARALLPTQTLAQTLCFERGRRVLRIARSGDKWLVYAVLTNSADLNRDPRIKSNRRQES
jgi:hypothetical protein